MAISTGAATVQSFYPDTLGSLLLDETWGVATTVINGRTYVYAAGFRDSGITMFSMDRNGVLSNPRTIGDTANTTLDFATTLKVADVAGQKFLIAASDVEDGISVFALGGTAGANEGVPVATDSAYNSVIGGLNGARYVETVSIGGRTFVISSSIDADTIICFQLSSAGKLTERDRVADQDNLNVLQLEGVGDIDVHQVGANQYLYAHGYGTEGISVFRIGANGTLTNVDNEAVPGFTNYLSVHATTAGTANFLIAASETQDNLALYRIAANGTLTAFNTFTGANDTTRDITGLTSIVVDGETFLAGASRSYDKVMVWHLEQNGTVTLVQEIADTALNGLNGAYEIAFDIVNERPILTVTGRDEDAVTSFEIGGGNDGLTGTTGQDKLFGFRGNDTLAGGNNVDKLSGGADADRLLGEAGADSLLGGTGNDRLFGGADADSLSGGDGRDTLDGGTGNDVLSGGAGSDRYIFGGIPDDDTIFGWDASDIIDLSAVAGFNAFADVVANATQVGADAVIDLGNGSSIRLEDVLVSSLVANDFAF